MRIIGITGTNGKTTVSYLVRHILRANGIRVGMLGTVEYDFCEGQVIPARLTTPSPDELDDFCKKLEANGCTHLVMEVSSHGLDQDRIKNIEFTTGAFLNLSQDHLDYHASMDDYFSAKKKLFTHKQPRNVVLNNASSFSKKIANDLRGDQDVLTFGIEKEADFNAKNSVLKRDRTEFWLETEENRYLIKSPLIGSINIENLLAAVAICSFEGLTLDDIIKSLKTFKAPPGRMERIKNLNIFVDFAHTPEGLKMALSTLRNVGFDKVDVVFGCGGNRDASKRPQMLDLAQNFADNVWVTSDNSRNEPIEKIFEDMKTGLSLKKTTRFLPDRKQAIQTAIRSKSVDTALLIAGKGHEQFQLIQNKKIPFSDKNLVLSML